jgi:hypothetical protein
MTEQEKIDLMIEKRAYTEVVKQLGQGDARMETGLNKFLTSIEDKVREIDRKLNGA